MKNIFDTLEARGFIEAKTSEEMAQLADKPLSIYIGFDPTSDSLHLGNFVGIMALAWFQRYSHAPVAIVGGATGMIGDPSGKSIERNLLNPQILEKNLCGIRRSLTAVIKEDIPILNNYDWFQSFGFLEFLRDVGKHFRVSTMLAKESVKSRLNSEEGISFTEFSYQLLQAYDFLYLYDHHNVTVQMGGSDQWGNITAGTELVRKMRGVNVYGATFPLLTRSDGKKFGKSEEGAIWLNPDRLSAYEFYQYLYRLPDADMPKMFRMLTFLELEEIRQIEADMETKSYVPNTAQTRLADEVTRLVHGEEGLLEAKRITTAAKPGSKTSLDKQTLLSLSLEIPSRTLNHSEVIGKPVLELLVSCQLLKSKSEARRMILSGGVYLNNEKVLSEAEVVEQTSLIEGEFLLLGVGKKTKMVIRCEG